MSPRALAFLIAASFTGLIYAVTRISGYRSLIQGIDSRPSTSKAQWWTRTAVMTFGHVAVFVERWLRGDPSSGLDVPQNLTDLGKIQYVAFTVLAVGVYVVCLATQCDTRTLPAMAGIAPSPMLLMGLSHSSYLGAKIIARSAVPQGAK